MVARVTLGAGFEGAPGRAHAGAISALLAETMAAALAAQGTTAMTTSLEVRYLGPIPLHVSLELRAQVAAGKGAAWRVTCQGTAGGHRFVEATGTFSPIDLSRFATELGRRGGVSMPALETTLVETPVGRFTADVAGPAAGALVLFLHGYPQSRHTWREQVPAVAAAGFRAVAVDQRGYSPGVRPDPAVLANYHVDRLVEDVGAVAEAYGEGARFHLVGHDWGGAVAWKVADRHPEWLTSLTVLSRPHPAAFAEAMRADADGQRDRSRHHRAFHDPGTARLLLDDGAQRLRRMLADNGVPPASIEEYVGVLGDLDAMEAALAWYRAVGTLAEMTAGPTTVPTLYIWGDADHSVGPTAAHGTATHVAGPYRFLALPGIGHFATDEAPAAVTDALLDQLTSVK